MRRPLRAAARVRTGAKLDAGQGPPRRSGVKSDAMPTGALLPTTPVANIVADHPVARLRELTDGFTPDAEACNAHRAMLAGFARLETDLHAYVHQKKTCPFPGRWRWRLTRPPERPGCPRVRD